MTHSHQRQAAGRVARTLLTIAVTLGLATSADAALLGLQQDYPDILAGSIKVTYTASNREFVVTGKATQLALESSQTFGISNSSYEIRFKVDANGMPILGDLEPNIKITGDITGLPGSPGLTSGTLLTGRIARFGFTTPAPGETFTPNRRRFEFEFDSIEGALSGHFGNLVGVILTSGKITYQGHFNSDFAAFDTTRGTANTFAEVPEPASLLVWSIGAMSFASVYRRGLRKKRSSRAVWYSGGTTMSIV